MRAAAESTSSLGEELAGPTNVLLIAPPLGEEVGDACSSLLSVASPDCTNLLSVTFNQSPDPRLERWRTTGARQTRPTSGSPSSSGVRSAPAAQPPAEAPAPDDPGPTIATVSNQADLTGISIELGNFFEDRAVDDNELRLCFHTLTTFLQYTDLRSAYRFLHVLTGRVQLAGCIAYHLDPAVHDHRTVNSLLALFDAVVERDAKGDLEVRRWR